MYKLILAVALLVAAIPALAQEVGELTYRNVVVQALDGDGQLLRSGMGFVLDEETVVTGYNTVKGASKILVKVDETRTYSNELIASYQLLDLALIKATEEIEETSPLASSDTVGVGDSVFFFSREKLSWKKQRATVKNWFDSGQGFELMQLQAPGDSRHVQWESSPLMNAAGQVVGWIHDPSTAVPLKAIHRMLSDKSNAVPLQQVNQNSRFWAIHKISPARAIMEEMEVYRMKKIYGPKQYPFELELPESWQSEANSQGNQFLLLSLETRAGIAVAVRAVPKKTEDLLEAIEQTEGMLLPGASRSELTPFQAGELSGLKALYEDATSATAYMSCVLYALSQSNFYVFSMTYPQNSAEQIQPIAEHILSSVRLK